MKICKICFAILDEEESNHLPWCPNAIDYLKNLFGFDKNIKKG